MDSSISTIINILKIFALMIAAGRTQEVFATAFFSANIVYIFTVLDPQHFMLVISAVGYTRKGERAGILLPFDLTPQSLHVFGKIETVQRVPKM